MFVGIVKGMGCDPAGIAAAIEEHLGYAASDSDMARLVSSVLTARTDPAPLANATGYVINALKNEKEKGKWRKVLAGEA